MSLGGSKGSSVAKGAQEQSSELMKGAYTGAEGALGEMNDFAMDFYNTYITPQINSITQAGATGQQRLDDIFGIQSDVQGNREGLYRDVGDPAIRDYMKKASEFSSAAYGEGMASRAIGDVSQQQLNQQGALDRTLGARGISAGSPAAMAARSGMDQNFSLAKAAASSRAREVADKMGLDVSAGAASLGANLGAKDWTAPMVGTAGAGLDTALKTTGGITAASTIPLSALGTSVDYYTNKAAQQAKLFGSTTDTYAKEQQSSAGGWGKAIGTALGAAAGTLIGGPAGTTMGGTLGGSLGGALDGASK